MHQTAMTGPDWLSESDKKAQARAEAARSKAARDCAKKLSAAAAALHAFSLACNACGDASAVTRTDDSRLSLATSIREYAGWLESKYDA